MQLLFSNNITGCLISGLPTSENNNNPKLITVKIVTLRQRFILTDFIFTIFDHRESKYLSPENLEAVAFLLNRNPCRKVTNHKLCSINHTIKSELLLLGRATVTLWNKYCELFPANQGQNKQMLLVSGILVLRLRLLLIIH